MKFLRNIVLIGLVLVSVIGAPPKNKKSMLVWVDGKRYVAHMRPNGRYAVRQLRPLGSEVLLKERQIIACRERCKSAWLERFSPLRRVFLALPEDSDLSKEFNALRLGIYNYQHDNRVVVEVDAEGSYHGFVCDERLAPTSAFDMAVVFDQLAESLALIEFDCNGFDDASSRGVDSGLSQENYVLISGLKESAYRLISLCSEARTRTVCDGACAGAGSGVVGASPPRTRSGKQRRRKPSGESVGVARERSCGPERVVPPAQDDWASIEAGFDGAVVPAFDEVGTSRFVMCVGSVEFLKD